MKISHFPKLIGFIFCTSITFSALGQFASKPNLKDEGNILIIEYSIIDSRPGDRFQINVRITDSDGNLIDAKSLTGDIGSNIVPNRDGELNKIEWYYNDDAIEYETKITVKIEYEKLERRAEDIPSGYKGDYFMLGVGYGNGYGGYGVRAQFRFGGNQGFGVHAGVGYHPDGAVLASAGIKYFFYRDIYINAQFGLSGYETYYDDFWGTWYEQRLFGPSVLAGVDLTWGGKVGFGFNAAIGGSVRFNAFNQSIFGLAFDLGLLLRF